jgi:hypothetical protein
MADSAGMRRRRPPGDAALRLQLVQPRKRVVELCGGARLIRIHSLVIAIPIPATFLEQVVSGCVGPRPFDHCYCAQVLPTHT